MPASHAVAAARRRLATPVRLRRLPLYAGAGVLVSTFLLFIASETLRDDDDSWLILTGSIRPTADTWYEDAIAGSLAIMGFLLLPTMIGLVIGAGLDLWLNSQRETVEDLGKKLEQRLRVEPEIDLRQPRDHPVAPGETPRP